VDIDCNDANVIEYFDSGLIDLQQHSILNNDIIVLIGLFQLCHQ